MAPAPVRQARPGRRQCWDARDGAKNHETAHPVARGAGEAKPGARVHWAASGRIRDEAKMSGSAPQPHVCRGVRPPGAMHTVPCLGVFACGLGYDTDEAQTGHRTHWKGGRNLS